MSSSHLTFTKLHERHRGITAPIADSYAEAATVCLNRFHTSPDSLGIRYNQEDWHSYVLTWPTPSHRQQDAWGNRDDTTESGAYCLVIAAVEHHLGLYVIGRALVGTGADYYLGIPGDEVNSFDNELDFENATRLEVSGISQSDNDAHLLRRVRQKVMQTQEGSVSGPALAGVVAFNLLKLILQEAQSVS